MATNLHYDICTIFVLVILLIAFKIRKLVMGRTNSIFCAMVVCLLMAIVFDVIGESYGYYIPINDFTSKVRLPIDTLYFVFRNVTVPLFVIYIASLLGVFIRYKQKKLFVALWVIPYLIDIVLLIINFFNSKVFYYNANSEYTRGPWMMALYVIAGYYFILVMIVLFSAKKIIEQERFYVLLLFLPSNLIAAYVQMYISNLHIDLFATALLLVIISIGVQRPEIYVDYRSGAYSYSAFNNHMRKVYDLGDPVALLIFKYANHKSINSSVGFDAYTVLLRTIAEKIQTGDSALKSSINTYFLDNGTFVLSGDIDREARIIKFGNEILQYANEPINLGSMEVMLEPIVCYLRFPVDINTVESLVSFISDMEFKLANAKELVDLSQIALTKDFKMRNDMDAIIKRGIVNSKFQMYYQPIYSINDDAFVSAEALIRLIDDEYGFVSPALFIPASEKSGAIHQIGDYVFKDVCRFIASDEYKNLGLKYIEINLSVAQCIETDLVTKFNITLIQSGVESSQINLEITETAADYDPEITDKNINALSDMGFSFSLDDYGTGYSNIKRVVSLPLDIVKLDKTLVDEMDAPQMWIVITNTVTLLKNMNKKILVEGVEDERALKRFTELGCDYIQGYYFSKPLPEKDFIKFIEDHKKN